MATTTKGGKGNGMTPEMEREVTERFGFVPKFLHSLPDHVKALEWSVMRDFGLESSALDLKVKHLIGLGVAAHIKCRYCIYFHTETAKAAGATAEELKEACFMGGYTAQWSNAITGSMQDFDEFKREVDRAIQFMTRQGAQPPGAHPTH